MNKIEDLIELNRQKYDFLDDYLDVNDMIIDMGRMNNFSAIRDLVAKKRGVITSIDVLDQKIVALVSALKREAQIEDLSQLSLKRYPRIKPLKQIAGKVLKKMVAAKASDKKSLYLIDQAFQEVGASDRPIDRNKIIYYTKHLLNDED